MKISLLEFYSRLLDEAKKKIKKEQTKKSKKKMLYDDEERQFCHECGKFHSSMQECGYTAEQNVVSNIAGYNAPMGTKVKKPKKPKKNK